VSCVSPDQIAFGDVLQMFLHIATELRLGRARVSAFGRADGIPCFQRELGIDDEAGRFVGEGDHAIRPVAVRERCLELVAADRQAVLDDGFHPGLAEHAARLLVGEDMLQSHHLAGQFGDVALGRVDDGETLVEPG
jgi:hypothetical protein